MPIHCYCYWCINAWIAFQEAIELIKFIEYIYLIEPTETYYKEALYYQCKTSQKRSRKIAKRRSRKQTQKENSQEKGQRRARKRATKQAQIQIRKDKKLDNPTF